MFFGSFLIKLEKSIRRLYHPLKGFNVFPILMQPYVLFRHHKIRPRTVALPTFVLLQFVRSERLLLFLVPVRPSIV